MCITCYTKTAELIATKHCINDFCCVLSCREKHLRHREKISCNDLRPNVDGFLIVLKPMHCFIVE